MRHLTHVGVLSESLLYDVADTLAADGVNLAKLQLRGHPAVIASLRVTLIWPSGTPQEAKRRDRLMPACFEDAALWPTWGIPEGELRFETSGGTVVAKLEGVNVWVRFNPEGLGA